MTQANTQAYELTFILGEKTQPEQAKVKCEEIKKYIKDNGGEITREELWGRRDLAYEIKHNRSGIYITLWFNFPPKELIALNQHIRFDEEIIRSLITSAVEYAQPGSLYVVDEEEKAPVKKEEKATAEEMIRMSSKSKAKSEPKAEEAPLDDIPDEERLKKLDEKLDELLAKE